MLPPFDQGSLTQRYPWLGTEEGQREVHLGRGMRPECWDLPMYIQSTLSAGKPLWALPFPPVAREDISLSHLAFKAKPNLFLSVVLRFYLG